jgi:hypothetical protein
MKKKWCFAALAAAGVVVQGCSTNLKVHTLAAVKKDPALQGAQYSLPFSRYKVSVARTLKDCGKPSAPKLTFDIAVTAEQLFEPDPSATFVIDTGSLSNVFKTSELSWELYENGMLKSVGASAEDQTGQVITSVLSAGLKIAQAVILPGTAAVGTLSAEQQKDLQLLQQKQKDSACKDTIVEVLHRLDAQRATLEKATTALDHDSARLKAMTDVIAPFGAAATDVIQGRVMDQAQAVASRQSDVTVAQNVLATAISRVTQVKTFVWPDDGRKILDNEREKLSAAALNDWLKKPADVKEQTIHLRIVPLNLTGVVSRDDTAVPNPIDPAQHGIRYRVPVRGELMVKVCGIAAPGVTNCAADDRVTKRVAQGQVPQFGRLYVIPFWNGPFQSNTLNLAFNKDGTMTSGKYAETKARAQVGSDAFNQAAGTVLAGLKDIKDLRVTRSQKELQEIKAQTELLQARKQLQDAAAALQPGSTDENDKQKAILSSDTALLDAQRAKIEAQLALDAARAKAQVTP